jgi:type IV secretory pathway VirB10-like protein
MQPQPENAAAEFSNGEEGNEVVLHGLVADPVDCWVIAYNDGILRLHFMASARPDAQISRLIEALQTAEAENAPAEDAPAVNAQAPRNRRKTIVAAILAPVLIGLVVYGVIVSGLLRSSGPTRDRLADAITDQAATRSPPDPAKKRRDGSRQAPGVVLGEGAEAKLASAEGKEATLFMLPTGTNLPASIVTAQESDGTGQVEAEMDGDVHDPTNPSRVLMPRHTRLFGRLAHAGADAGQSLNIGQTLNIVWTSVVLPNGKPLKFVSLGDGVDQPVSSAKDAPLVTLGTSGIAGSRISVHVNRDIALPAFPAAQPKGTDTK